MDTKKNGDANSITITGDWNAQSKELKTQYNQLTEDDLKFEEGKEHELITRVQSRLKKNRTEVVELLRSGQVEPQ